MRFRSIVCAADVAHAKPDPEGYLLAAAKLGVEPRQCIALEDSLNGVSGGGGGRLPDGGRAERGSGPGSGHGRVVLDSLAGMTLADLARELGPRLAVMSVDGLAG